MKPAPTYDGIILAGGQARRLGGVSKPALEVGGRRLIDIAVAALAGAATVVAVGAPLPTDTPVTWTREEPAGGGPVAALAAALPHVREPAVVVLAADLPFVTAVTVEALVRTLGASVAAVAVDPAGHVQPLLACYRADALRRALPEVVAGAAMRTLLTALAAAGPIATIDVGGTPPVTWDCDTASDLTRAREMA